MVKDLDVQGRELTLGDVNGGKDRLTLLPQSLVAGLQAHQLKVRHLRQFDVAVN